MVTDTDTIGGYDESLTA